MRAGTRLNSSAGDVQDGGVGSGGLGHWVTFLISSVGLGAQYMNSSLPKKVFRALGGYIRRHPEELLRAAKNATSLKVGVPVRALLWVAKELGGESVPADLHLEARAPGIFARASFEMMKTPLRGSANIIIDEIKMSEESILLKVRVEDISLVVTEENVGTPVAALLQSGALDLSRPGDLISYMPQRPALLVEASGNVLTLDLMKHPKLSAEGARKLVRVLIPLIEVDAIRTDGEHLDVAFSALPGGAQEVVEQFRKLF